jgi:hypothetical protein
MSCKLAAAAAPNIRASALWEGAATATGFLNRHNLSRFQKLGAALACFCSLAIAGGVVTVVPMPVPVPVPAGGFVHCQ